MMVKLPKAIHGGYWWEPEGNVCINPEFVESFEQIYDRTPGGSRSPAYVLVTMKSGVRHKVFEFLSKLEELLT